DGRGFGGNLFIVGASPVLTPWQAAGGARALHGIGGPTIGVHGHAGEQYLLQGSATVDGSGGWTNLGLLSMTEDYDEFEITPPASGHRFLRLLTTEAFDPGLDIAPGTGGLILHWNSGVLESAPTVKGPWSAVPGASAPEHSLAPTGAGEFYRVRQ
ncbi:MAG: hypothetical protein KDM81_09810, partial [Verrucomicrobiae bacterium]|nr:hypothetical protein [Verrucomicrobiae bacterium]